MRKPSVSRLVFVFVALSLMAGSVLATGGIAAARGHQVTRHYKLLHKGVLTVGTDASYPPMESYNSNTNQIVGADVGLGKAIAKAMGLKKANFVNRNFDYLIKDMNSLHQFDIIMSSMNDTPSRRKEGLRFVHYLKAVEAIMVKKGSSIHANTYRALCGHTVSVEKDTTELDGLNAANKHCKSPISIQAFDQDTEAFQAFVAGHVDAYTSDYPVVAKYVKNHPTEFQLAGKVIKTGQFYGIAIPKKNASLFKAIQRAFSKVRKSGQYMRILKKWGVAKGHL